MCFNICSVSAFAAEANDEEAYYASDLQWSAEDQEYVEKVVSVAEEIPMTRASIKNGTLYISHDELVGGAFAVMATAVAAGSAAMAAALTAVASSIKDELDIVVKLWKEKSCMVTWKASGEGYVFLSKNKTVEKNHEYTLTIDATINGQAQPTASFTATCK